MADIQQQIADGARPLARVGDVIEHGQDIPANVRSVRDKVKDLWERERGGWILAEYDGSPTSDAERSGSQPASEPHMLMFWAPLKVVEVDSEPQPERDVEDDVHYYVPELRPMSTFCGIGLEEDNDLSVTDVPGKATCDTCRAEADEDAASPKPVTSDPGTFAECVAWLIEAGLGDNADRRIDRMAAQYQELQARYDTVKADRETIRGALNLRKERCRKEHGGHTDESGRAVLSLPQVPDGAVALVGGKSGKRWVPINRRTTWQVEGTTEAVTEIGLLLYREGTVTVEFAPPREPRTWPKLDPAPAWDDVLMVDVEGHGRWELNEDTDLFMPLNGGAEHSLPELRLLGKVREVFDDGQ